MYSIHKVDILHENIWTNEFWKYIIHVQAKQNYVKLESELLILLKSILFLSSSRFGKGFETITTEYGKSNFKIQEVTSEQ